VKSVVSVPFFGIIGVLIFSFATIAAPGKSREKTEGPTVVLPTFTVIGTRIPSSWLEVSYECKGPTPLTQIKKAWISKVGRGTPAETAGLKTGDILLSFDNQATDTMTGFSLEKSLRTERAVGTRLEMIIQSPDAEKRTVVIVFK